MTATTIEINHHLQELRRVASDLRNERTFGSPVSGPIGRIRLAVGDTLVQLGTALLAGSRRTSVQAR